MGSALRGEAAPGLSLASGAQELFPCKVHKLLIVVELLLGEIPDRLQFRQPSLKRSLMPYFLLTQGTVLLLGPCPDPASRKVSGGSWGAAGVPLPSLIGAHLLQQSAVSEGPASPFLLNGAGGRWHPVFPPHPSPPSLPPSPIFSSTFPCSRQDREPGQVQPSPRSVWGQVPGRWHLHSDHSFEAQRHQDG